MIKTLTLSKEQKPTKEQLQEVENAKKYPIEFDDDCEELSDKMIKAFQCSITKRKNQRITE